MFPQFKDNPINGYKAVATERHLPQVGKTAKSSGWGNPRQFSQLAPPRTA
ncbi:MULTISPECIES: hypothetical protein [unclassified Anabaena]